MNTWFITGIGRGKALALAGRIDVLVNNAVYGLLGAVEEATDDEVERLFAVNVGGFRTDFLSEHSIRRSDGAVAEAYAWHGREARRN